MSGTVESRAQSVEDRESRAERREMRAPEFRSVCAWCEPGVREENTTHGICDMHAEAMLAEIRAKPIS